MRSSSRDRPGYAAINDYTGQDRADHKLPALTVSTAFRGEVRIIVEQSTPRPQGAD